MITFAQFMLMQAEKLVELEKKKDNLEAHLHKLQEKQVSLEKMMKEVNLELQRIDEYTGTLSNDFDELAKSMSMIFNNKIRIEE